MTDSTHFYDDGCNPPHVAPLADLLGRPRDSATLYNDDDVAALRPVCALYAPSPDSDVDPMARAVLDAVLPAYRARLLNEMADEVSDYGIPGVIGCAYVVDWLHAKAEETP